MDGTREEALRECDSVTRQLNEELHQLINGKWNNDRKLFKQKKRIVIMLLKNLTRDVKSISRR